MKIKLINKKTFNNKVKRIHPHSHILSTALESSAKVVAGHSKDAPITKDNVASLLKESNWARSTGLLVFDSDSNSNVACVNSPLNPNGGLMENSFKEIDLSDVEGRELVDVKFSSDYFRRQDRVVKRIVTQEQLKLAASTQPLFIVRARLSKDLLAEKRLNLLGVDKIPNSSALVLGVGTESQPESIGMSGVMVDTSQTKSTETSFKDLLDPSLLTDINKSFKGGEYSECKLVKLYDYADVARLLSDTSISLTGLDQSRFDKNEKIKDLKTKSNSEVSVDDPDLGCLILLAANGYLSRLLIGRTSDLDALFTGLASHVQEGEVLHFYSVYPSYKGGSVSSAESPIELRLLISDQSKSDTFTAEFRAKLLRSNFSLMFGSAIGLYESSYLYPDRGEGELQGSNQDVLYRQRGELLSYTKKIKARYSLANQGDLDGAKTSLLSLMTEMSPSFLAGLPVKTTFSAFNNKTGYAYCALPSSTLGKDKNDFLIVGSDESKGFLPMYPLFSFGRSPLIKVTQVASSDSLELSPLLAINGANSLRALRSEDTSGHGLSGVGGFRVVFSDKNSSGGAYYLGSLVLGPRGYYLSSGLDKDYNEALRDLESHPHHVPVFIDETSVLDGELRVYSYYAHTNLVMQAVLHSMDVIGVPAYVDKYSWDVDELRSTFGSPTNLRALYSENKTPVFRPMSKGYISAGLVRELGAYNNLVANNSFKTLINYSDGYRVLGKLIEALVDRRLLDTHSLERFIYKNVEYSVVPAIPLRDVLLAEESALTGVVDCNSCQPFNNCIILD